MRFIYERACVDGTDWLIRREDTPKGTQERESCLAYLRDCEHVITTEVVDKPISWGDLSERLEPRDD